MTTQVERQTLARTRTDTKPEKIGAAIYLSLKGKAQEVVRKLTETTIGHANGYAEIIKALDHVYLADATKRTFTAFKEFYEFRREGGMDFFQVYCGL